MIRGIRRCPPVFPLLMFVLLLPSSACSTDSSVPGMDFEDVAVAADLFIPIGQPCSKNADCGDGYCDPIEGACVMCSVDSHCPGEHRCVAGACLEGILCQPNSGSCDEEGNAVVCNAVGTAWQVVEPCDDEVECTKDGCIEGAGCTHLPLPDVCDDDNDCTLDECDLEDGCHYEVADECKTGGIADVTPPKAIFADTIPEDQVAKEVVAIHNAGLGELKIFAFSTEPKEGPFYFEVEGDSSQTEKDFSEPLVIVAGETYDLTITFAPLAIGEYEGTLTIETNDPTKSQGLVTVPLKGSGVADNCIGVDPEVANFGAVGVGTTKELDVLIENCGEGLVPIYAISLLENSGGTFSTIASLSPPFDLDVGQSTVLTLGFAPVKPGESYEARIVIENGVPQNPMMEVQLTGTGK
jgi:hypothetical protein